MASIEWTTSAHSNLVHYIKTEEICQNKNSAPEKSLLAQRLPGLLGTDQFEKRPDARIIGLRFDYLFKGGLGFCVAL